MFVHSGRLMEIVEMQVTFECPLRRRTACYRRERAFHACPTLAYWLSYVTANCTRRVDTKKRLRRRVRPRENLFKKFGARFVKTYEEIMQNFSKIN